jgi:hypothetical protein
MPPEIAGGFVGHNKIGNVTWALADVTRFCVPPPDEDCCPIGVLQAVYKSLRSRNGSNSMTKLAPYVVVDGALFMPLLGAMTPEVEVIAPIVGTQLENPG